MGKAEMLAYGRNAAASPPAPAAAWPLAKLKAEVRRDVTQDLKIGIHETLAGLEADWRRMEEHADMSPFQSFDWLTAWLKHIGRAQGVLPCIAVGRCGPGDPLFIMPLMITRSGPLRVLTWLGSDTNDYNAPILHAGFAVAGGVRLFPALWTGITAMIRNTPRLRFDFVNLAKMPETVGNQSNPFLTLPVALTASRAHAATLAASWDEFYGRRSSATRRRDRTKLRRLGEFGEVTYFEPRDDGGRRRIVSTLIALKSRHLARMGVRNLFASPGYRAFLDDIATGGKTRNFVHVSGLKVGETLAAVNLGLSFRNCFYHILMSYETGDIAKFGPGAAHLRELLRQAIASGKDRFDFTIGDEPYKKEWCDRELKLYDHLTPASFAGALAVAVGKGYLGLKRAIKNSPLAWRLYSRARSMAGRLKAAGPAAADASGSDETNP